MLSQSLNHILLVSIHASARDATLHLGIVPGAVSVSIHASARDATHNTPLGKEIIMFQSTRPRGTRHGDSKHFYIEKVSIHASARDATSFSAPSLLSFAFQSTRPRGTRHYDEVIQPLIDVSIHASARDATAHFRLCRHGAPVSIHASARDATVTANGVPEYILVSIHASARDATRQRTVSAITGEFQSTRPRGTRPKHHIYCDREASFNPRVRAGRDVSKYERF